MNFEKGRESINKLLDNNTRIRWGILVLSAILFIIILYPSLVVTKHQYNLGDVVERDIKAKRDFFIEDQAATDKKRQQAVADVLTVYDFDANLVKTLNRNVEQAFGDLRSVIEQYPKNLLEELETQSEPEPVEPQDPQPSLQELIRQKQEQFEETISIRVSQGAYQALANEGFSIEIANLINKILATILNNGVVTNKEILLKELDKGIILRDVATKKESIAGNLNQFYGLNQAKAIVRTIGQPDLKDLDYTIKNLVVDFVQELIQPNITLNRSETQERQNKVSAEITPVLYKIKAGEMLLREGARVSELDLLKLEALQSETKKEQVLFSSLGAGLLLISLLITTYVLHLNVQGPITTYHNKNLLLIACLSMTFFFLAEISASFSELLTHNSPVSMPGASIYFGIPLASGAMIICLFLGLAVAVPMAMVLAIGFAFIFQNSFEMFIYFLISGTMAAYWLRSCRERKVFIIAGAKLGLLNIVLATAIHLYLGELSTSKLIWDWAFAFMGGVVAGILTAGIVPLVEIAFDYTTDITLLELAQLDRPIMRRLMIEAPGTYHHSVIVGSLVEAAATQIGANPLLAKVCGYYHDIGKIRKPLYFIENQTDGRNKHDKLAPSMSGLILIAHIKDGVEIARENKLGQVIIDTIRQHHGTSIIKFFYEKAKQKKGEDNVNIDDFRYPGPKPQTKEAGLVMLADVVEAASRTLDNPTPSRIQGLVQKLINQIFSDGQLDSCELTLKDLHNIAKSFNKILYGIHHHRIEYSESRATANENDKGKLKNGSSNRQQARQTQDLKETDSSSGERHLKRLGLS
ncbi:MAG: HDIG domain-containing protein [Deltaproteobacteria bacterium]|jgi:putative nucleotidyltransferase with HDIG domain|nr:HDIG domain-containing protein [Deltaproteobacteria bacterium]